MKHTNREDLIKSQEQPTAPPKVKQKTSLFSKIKTGCCILVLVGLGIGGVYLYNFYQEIKDELNVEIEKDKQLYNETKDTIEKANENYQEFNETVEEGKEYIDKANDVMEKINEN